MEGNILDRYQYPTDGYVGKGSILRLTEYLHYYFKEQGYRNIVFYDSIRGFYNTCEDGYIQNFSKLINVQLESNTIKMDFKGRNGKAAICCIHHPDDVKVSQAGK